MRAFFLALALLGPVGYAADSLVLPDMNGVVIAGLFDRSAYQYTAGKAIHCQDSARDSLVITNCDLEGTTSRVRGPGGVEKAIIWKRFVLMYDPTTFPGLYDYLFVGDWADKEGPYAIETQVSMDLRYDVKRPRMVRGFMSLQRYGIRYGIEGAFAGAALP